MTQHTGRPPLTVANIRQILTLDAWAKDLDPARRVELVISGRVFRAHDAYAALSAGQPVLRVASADTLLADDRPEQ